jgi:hypothetical protein
MLHSDTCCLPSTVLQKVRTACPLSYFLLTGSVRMSSWSQTLLLPLEIEGCFKRGTPINSVWRLCSLIMSSAITDLLCARNNLHRILLCSARSLSIYFTSASEVPFTESCEATFRSDLPTSIFWNGKLAWLIKRSSALPRSLSFCRPKCQLAVRVRSLNNEF